MVFTCCSIASSNFISAPCLMSHERRLERKGLTVLIGCIPVHKTHGSPATSFTADIYVGCTVETMRLRLWCIAWRCTTGQLCVAIIRVYTTICKQQLQHNLLCTGRRTSTGAVPLVSQTTQSDTTMRQLGRSKPASAGLCVA